MRKVYLFLLVIVVLVSVSCAEHYVLDNEPPETELHIVSVAVTALMADPDMPAYWLDEFPTNSFVECNPEGNFCTRDMNLLATINSGSIGK